MGVVVVIPNGCGCAGCRGVRTCAVRCGCLTGTTSTGVLGSLLPGGGLGAAGHPPLFP
jgi:hypothetical protein